jgi:hypothetical protein
MALCHWEAEQLKLVPHHCGSSLESSGLVFEHGVWFPFVEAERVEEDCNQFRCTPQKIVLLSMGSALLPNMIAYRSGSIQVLHMVDVVACYLLRLGSPDCRGAQSPKESPSSHCDVHSRLEDY